MTRHAPQAAHTLPETCIRGPELADLAAIAAEVRAADPAALSAYQQGMELLLAARALLDAQRRLEELTQTRAFLLRQLETLEQQQPERFADALATYERRQANPAAPTSEEGQPCDPPHLAAP